MNVKLKEVAIVPKGLTPGQMDELWPYLYRRFEVTTPTQILKVPSGLSDVELRLQSLPGVDAITPVSGLQNKWIEAVDLMHEGLIMVPPLEWVKFLARNLFAGYDLWQDAQVGESVVGEYAHSSGVTVIPFKR